MTPLPVSIAAAVASFALLVVVFELIRSRRLRERYALLWLLTGVVLLGLSLWRGGLNTIAGWFGVETYPPAILGAIGALFILVVPLYVAEMVTGVDAETLLVVRLKPQIVAPAPTLTLAGTLATDGLLLDSETDAPPCGAPAVSVTVPPPLLPPVTFDGLSARLCNVGGGGGP